VDRHRVAVAPARDERTHDRVVGILEHGVVALVPGQPATVLELQLAHDGKLGKAEPEGSPFDPRASSL
jgi:hypothetical protein